MPEPLSFCLVTTFYPPYNFGGDGLHVHRLAGLLSRQGHHVRVVHAPGAYNALADGDVELAPEDAALPGVEVVAVGSHRAQLLGTYLTGRPITYRRSLEDAIDGADVVHFHNPSLIGGPGALGTGPGLQLYTTHEHWLLCPTHGLFRYGKEVCTARTCWRCTASYGRPPQLWRSTSLLRRRLARLDVVMSPSRFTAALHRSEFPDLRIETVTPPGPEPDAIRALAPARIRDHPYLLFAGRLEPIKGAVELVEAFRAVRGEIELVVVGEGSQRAEIQELASHDRRVSVLGGRSHPDVLRLVRDARALVVPSVGYETFGASGAEAMTLGTPVIVRDLGPLPELVDGGGGLVAAGPPELTGAMQLLADDPAEAVRLGHEARGVAAERFSETTFLVRYFGLVASAARARDRARVARLAEAAAGEAA